MDNDEDKELTITAGSDNISSLNLDDILASLPSLDNYRITVGDSTLDNSQYNYATNNNFTFNTSQIPTLNTSLPNNTYGINYPGQPYQITGSPPFTISNLNNFDSDVTIQGKSLMKTLEKIERRLAILEPDAKKLEHFEALKKAYEHYKTLEALCDLPEEEDE